MRATRNALMKICLILSLFLLTQMPQFVAADELGQSSQLKMPVESRWPKKRPKELTIEDIILEYERQLAAKIPVPSPRPKRGAKEDFKAPIPTPTEGFLAPNEYYQNPEGLPGIYVLFNPTCKNFIKDDGSIGPWGQKMLSAMKEVDKDYGSNCFNGGIKFGQRCPGFQKLNKAEQDHVWVWLWASVAQAESSCQPDAQAEGIYNEKHKRFNTADGLLQLEYSTETRNSNNRDRRYCPDRADTQAINFQMRCAASIMSKSQCGGYLKDKGSYWLKLGKEEGTIWDLLKKHPLCGGKG